MGVKRIPVTKLKVGMYVAGLDRSWWASPFLRHRFLLDSEAQLQKLQRQGVQEVWIDSAKGLDEDPDQDALWQPPQPDLPEAQKSQLRTVKSREILAQEFAAAQKARQELLHSVESVFETLISTGLTQGDQVKQAVEDVVVITETLEHPAAFMALSGAREFDPALNDHALSVCSLSLILGRALGYDSPTLHRLASGALLHDIGLLRLPHHILRSAHQLSKHDRAKYETHPRIGATWLESSGTFHGDIVRIVAEHHATPDNKGFPPETPGRWTHETSRIVMVVDRYDELVTGQGSETPVSIHGALSQLYQDGQSNRLDARLVTLFIKLIGIYPVYSLVELNTGERGMVTALNPETLHQPIVTLFHDAEGHPYTPPIEIDLTRQDQQAPARSIVRQLDPDQAGSPIENRLVG